MIWSDRSEGFPVGRPLNLERDAPGPGFVFQNLGSPAKEIRLHELRDAELLWWNYGTVVLDAAGEIVPELSFSIGERPPLDAIRAMAPTVYSGTTASVMSWVPANYSHILCESLPLIQALHEAGLLSEVDAVLHDGWGKRLMEETLGLYGSNAEAVGVGKRGRAQFARLLAFEPLEHPAHKCHDVCFRFFDRVRDRAGPVEEGERKLIVRRPQGRRGFANLDAMLAALPGFEAVDLDGGATLVEQAGLFKGASVVVGGHGAGLTNLVFCRDGATFVEIFNAQYGTPAFWVLAAKRGLRYHAEIDAAGLGPFSEARKFDDIRVDVPRLAALLGTPAA